MHYFNLVQLIYWFGLLIHNKNNSIFNHKTFSGKKCWTISDNFETPINFLWCEKNAQRRKNSATPLHQRNALTTDNQFQEDEKPRCEKEREKKWVCESGWK